MTIVSKQTLDNLGKINLHDAEIREVICNYYDHIVQIPIIISKGKSELFFREVLFVDMSIYEPWGAGMYVHELTAQNESNLLRKYAHNDDSKLHFTILLNSGDSINVIASKVELKRL